MGYYDWGIRPSGPTLRGTPGKRVTYDVRWPVIVLERHGVAYEVDILTSEVRRLVDWDHGNWLQDAPAETLASGETIGNALDRLARSLCEEVQDEQ
jgi:hypothetical protein